MAVAARRWLWLWLAVGTLAGAAVALVVRAAFEFGWSAAILFALPLGLLGNSASLSAWYVLKSTPVERGGSPRAVITVVVSALVVSALWASLGQLWWRALAASGFGLGDPYRPGVFALLLSLGMAGYLLAAAAYQVGLTMEATSRASRRALEADVAQRDAELRALRSQIDPHFLFNSLNSIAGLISADPGRAREMCQLLGEFLRESLKLGPNVRIALAREVAFVEQYLRIEQVRFGARLSVEIEMVPETADASVPPLLLQPLVENAVRHGVATRIDGGTVAIVTRRVGDRVVVTVSNPRDEDARRGGTGLGLANVRRRLEATFGDRASLAVEPGPESYRAAVSFPYEVLP